MTVICISSLVFIAVIVSPGSILLLKNIYYRTVKVTVQKSLTQYLYFIGVISSPSKSRGQVYCVDLGGSTP